MLFCINELCKAFDTNEIEALLLPTILKMCEDTVPNVRFNVAKTLGQINIETKCLEEKVTFEDISSSRTYSNGTCRVDL